MQRWQMEIRKLEVFFSRDPFRRAFEATDEALSYGVAENFAKQVDHRGRPWPPRKDNLPHPLLVKTGNLLRAATTPGAFGHKFERQGDTVLFGVYGGVIDYAIYHHTGTSRMPMRRVIYPSAAAKRRAFDAFGRGLRRDFGSAMLG